jgi:predicted DNA-binding ribbon-helix-helix protein
VYEEKLTALKKISLDFRRRLKEHDLRPKVIAGLLQSLNLSTTFFNQVANMTERDEIYTSKDLEELWKTNKETLVTTRIWLSVEHEGLFH